jgi:serine/threonine protein kinase
MTSIVRISKYDIIKNLISFISTSVYDVCVNGETLYKKKFESIKEIGSGSFGTAYLIELNDYKFVIKETVITQKDIRRINDNFHSIDILDREAYTEEFRIMSMLTDNMRSFGFPNFIFAYKAAICRTCHNNDTCFMSFMEPAIGDLNNFSKSKEGSKLIKDSKFIYNMIYQLFLGMCLLHLEYGIYHRDIKSDNILVLKVKPGGYFKYIMDDKEYLVKNYGYIFCIHDFGISFIYNPRYSRGHNYGTRNVKIDKNGILNPIRCELFKDNKDSSIIWYDNKNQTEIIGTNNLFMSFTNQSMIEPNYKVKLEKLKQFPPFEFTRDLDRLIDIFIEEKSVFIENMPFELIYKLESLKFENFSFDVNNDAIFFRADMMLDYLYDKPINVYSIIETFNY